MGMLSYALAGAVDGGAKTYLDIAKDKRTEDMQTKRDKRLNQYKIDAVEKQQEFTAGENEKSIAADAANTDKQIKADAEKPVAVGSGTDLVTRAGDVVYQNDDRPAKGSGSDLTQDKADKFFRSGAVEAMGGNEFTALDEEKSIMATRMASLASKMWAKEGGTRNLNHYLEQAHRIVKDNPTITEENIQALIDEAKEEDSGFFDSMVTTDDEKQKIADAESQADQLRGNRWDTSLPGQGGMLTEDLGAQPKEIQIPPAIRTRMKEGKVYEMNSGPYAGKRIAIQNGKPVLM